jgi:hypothetical protein
MTTAGGHDADLGAHPQCTIHHPHQRHDTDVVVEPRIDDEGLQRALRVALGRRNPLHQLFEQVLHTQTRLGADHRGIVRRYADDLLDLANDLGRIRRGQVDLVDDRQDFQSLFQRGVTIGDALRFDALRRIHHQQRTLAGGQRTRHFVREIDVARRVDEIQLIDLATGRFERQCHALGLDRDAALALQIHGIEHLRLHFPILQAAALLDEPIGQR